MTTQILQIDREELRNELRAILEELKADAECQAAAEVRNLTMTTEETARSLGVSLPTLWRWERRGILKPLRLGSRKLYKVDDVKNLLNNGVR